MQMTKRVLSLLLSLALLCTLTPMGFTAAAEEITEEIVEQSTEQITEEVPADPENLLLPDDASAEDIGTDAIGTQIPVIGEAMPIEPWINPLYEGIIDAGDLPAVEPQQKPDAYVQATFVDATTAAEQLKEAMKNRTATITLHVFHTSSDYNALLDALLAVAMIHDGDPKGGDYLAGHFFGLAEGSQVLPQRVSGGYNYTFELNMVYSTTASQEATLDSNVNYVLNKLNVSGKSDYEKIRAVYEYMCKYIRYDYGHLSDPDYLLQFSAYAALVKGTSVCQGYATLFYRFMMELGIDCRMVTGIGGDAENYGPHAWNIVAIDGLYYNLDSTWDEGITNYGWFLRNTWNFPYHYRDYVYDSLEFHTVYPMAAEDYTPGVPGETDPFITGGYCGDNAIWLFSRYGELAITGTGAMYDYGSDLETMPDWSYLYGDYITAVYVDEGITRIGNCCFSNLSNVTDVVLPEGLQEIGDYAFANCTKLPDILLPAGLTKLGEYAFQNCTAFTQIDIPQGVTTIPFGTFSGCSGVTKITLPEGLEKIQSGAFSYTAITEIQLPSSLVELAGFSNCAQLEKIHIPENVTTVTDFSNCTGLTELYIPENVTYFGAFDGCKNLKTVVIAAPVSSIPYYGFHGCSSLTSITFPDTITEIGAYAFRYCSQLADINLGSSLQTIGNNAFESCKALTALHFPESLTVINSNAFAWCNKLTSLYFEGDAPIFGHNALYSLSVTVYYPGDNVTWNDVIQKNHGAFSITWNGGGCEHEYASVVTAPTCTEQGYTTKTCTLCGEVTVTDYVDARGHSPSEVQIENNVPATCIAAGSYDKVTGCTVCNVELSRETVTVDMLPHTPGEVQLENVIPVTCSAPGSYDEVVYCETCSTELSRESFLVDPIAHTYTSQTVAPTCTTEGYTSYTCSVCGHSYTDQHHDALGHDYQDDHCTRCGRPEHYLGDVNGDDVVDAMDAYYILMYYREKIAFTELQLTLADVDGNGRVDTADVYWITLYVNGRITAFPKQ